MNPNKLFSSQARVELKYLEFLLYKFQLLIEPSLTPHFIEHKSVIYVRDDYLAIKFEQIHIKSNSIRGSSNLFGLSSLV